MALAFSGRDRGMPDTYDIFADVFCVLDFFYDSSMQTGISQRSMEANDSGRRRHSHSESVVYSSLFTILFGGEIIRSTVG